MRNLRGDLGGLLAGSLILLLNTPTIESASSAMVIVATERRQVIHIPDRDAVPDLVDEYYPNKDAVWRSHFKNNLRQLCRFDAVGTGRSDRGMAENWVRIADVVWLRLDGTTEYVPLVGTVKHMYESVMQHRLDFPFSSEQLNKLIPSRSGKQKIQELGVDRKRDTPKWRVVPPPRGLYSLRDGQSLTDVNDFQVSCALAPGTRLRAALVLACCACTCCAHYSACCACQLYLLRLYCSGCGYD